MDELGNNNDIDLKTPEIDGKNPIYVDSDGKRWTTVENILKMYPKKREQDIFLILGTPIRLGNQG